MRLEQIGKKANPIRQRRLLADFARFETLAAAAVHGAGGPRDGSGGEAQGRDREDIADRKCSARGAGLTSAENREDGE